MPNAPAEPGALLADWRHLGVMPRGGRALVVGGACPDLEPVFDVTTVDTWEEMPASPATFQLVVGCARMVSRESIAGLERALDPSGGVLVICVPPRQGRTAPRKPFALQARSTRRLLRGSRLEAHARFGALPDPWAPEYVFPLTRAAGAFALEQFVLSRRPTWRWARTALRFGPLVDLIMLALPAGLLLCRLRTEAP